MLYQEQSFGRDAYLSAEVQSVYSTGPVDWAIIISLFMFMKSNSKINSERNDKINKVDTLLIKNVKFLYSYY